MRWDYVLFYVCFLGYIREIYRFCGIYLNGFRIDKKVAIVLFLALETMISLNGSVGAPYFLSALISHVLFAGLVMAVFSDHVMKKLFTAAVCIAVKTLVWNFGESFFACIALACTKWMSGGRELFMAPWLTGVISGASCLLVAAVFAILRKRLSPVYHNKSGSWYLALSLLLFGITAVIDVVNWGSSNGIMVTANGAIRQEAYYNQIFSHLGICLVTALLMCIAGGSVFLMHKVYLEQQLTEEYSARIAYYKMLNEQYLQMERLRHDMKNHVLALHGLWEKRAYGEAGAYLENMMESARIDGNDEVSGNRAVDALLYDKKRRAQALSLRWDCNVQIPKESKVETFDLCVLLGNLLDNAIKAGGEAADKEHRFVSVQAGQVKKCFLLVVKNGTILKDIREMKRGIGTINIDETIKKYGGTAKRSLKNGIFEISVLFPGRRDG